MKDFQVYWFTGQAGAGKTELGKKMLEFLTAKSTVKHVIIDGDDIRAMFDNTDYSVDGRKKNVEFVQRLCTFLAKNDIVPIVCMVSPFLDQRELLKENLNVYEVYVHCSEIRGREEYHVDYYQKPENKYLSIDTTAKSVEESFQELIYEYDELYSKSR